MSMVGGAVVTKNYADVIGIICGGTSLEDVTRVLREMREVCSKPLAAKPNAGIPGPPGQILRFSESSTQRAELSRLGVTPGLGEK